MFYIDILYTLGGLIIISDIRHFSHDWKEYFVCFYLIADKLINLKNVLPLLWDGM